jgi:hypothetical protein
MAAIAATRQDLPVRGAVFAGTAEIDGGLADVSH